MCLLLGSYTNFVLHCNPLLGFKFIRDNGSFMTTLTVNYRSISYVDCPCDATCLLLLICWMTMTQPTFLVSEEHEIEVLKEI